MEPARAPLLALAEAETAKAGDPDRLTDPRAVIAAERALDPRESVLSD